MGIGLWIYSLWRPVTITSSDDAAALREDPRLSSRDYDA
jgi:hypothetical protein